MISGSDSSADFTLTDDRAEAGTELKKLDAEVQQKEARSRVRQGARVWAVELVLGAALVRETEVSKVSVLGGACKNGIILYLISSRFVGEFLKLIRLGDAEL